ncbi:glycoside hydrolase [Gramella sp. ASW11-100T]|uniref:Glycoside hydrolase n=2 Tax=Christiangramia sediminis TaxID=2881336 RepID=A0A9X1LKV2_9FLAO|nr:glycoside hydrolase [Christiangramia sediminis]
MFSFFLLNSCAANSENFKLNGISLVASRDSITEDQVSKIVEVNANSVALMPYAFMREKSDPELIYNIERQWFGERLEGIEHTIMHLKSQNLRIMMKPHIWLRNGDFTGDLKFSSEAEWEKFETSYRKYLMLYAELSEKHHLEILCIGTELYNFVKERPEFWNLLISDIRKIYKGKLVYAENWDKVDQVDIWDKIDFIGVDAYFPLSDQVSPSEDEIVEGWQKHKSMLEDLSSEYDKPILFTEYGYRSMDHALKEPWNSNRDISEPNHNLQARALKILYEEFWTNNWFAGGYLWKWDQHEGSGGLENDRFTPQNKPAENMIKEYYRKFRN